MSDPFVTPLLFSILCVMLGAGLFSAPYLWLFQVLRAPGPSPSLGWSAFSSAMFALWGVAFFSLLRGLYQTGGLFWPEAMVVSALALGAFAYKKMQEPRAEVIALRLLYAGVKAYLWMGGFLVLSSMVIAALIVLLNGVNVASATVVFNPIREATFFVGVLWVAALWRFHMYVHARRKEAVKLDFHHLLWPLVVGLFLLMVPLLVQDMVNSEKFKESMHAPARVQKI